MKKFLTCVAMLAVCATTLAQEAKQETKYRRSSLYSMMIPDDDLQGEELTIVTNAFLEKAFPDKYNNHNLEFRVFSAQDLKNIDVTQNEIKEAEEMINGSKGKAKKAIGKIGNLVKKATSSASDTAQKDDTKNAGYVAKLNKYFEQNKVAQKMFAKWLGGGESAPKSAQPINYSIVEERALQTLSQEEIATNRDLYLGEAVQDVVPRTFITVNRYSYVPAEEIIAYMTAAASTVGGSYATLAGAGLAQVIKGYFVKTTTYLYQLDLDADKVNELVDKYANDITGIYSDESIKLKFVGKTTKFAPATLKLSAKSDADQKLISRATVRATDASIADLQKEYDQFKTLSTIHQNDDGTLYAYVGKKEGVKSGDKFEVLQRTMKDGKESYEVIGSVKVEKKGVWDNREGAGEVIEGAATTKEDDDANSSLTYTLLGSSKKMLEGSLIRQVK